MRVTYRVLPDGGGGCDVTSRWIPVNVGDTVVVGSVHQHKVGRKILLALLLLTIKIHIVELHLERLLRMDGSNNNEATSWRPVDSVGVLLIVCADVLEVTDGSSSLGLLWAVERDRGLWWDSGGNNWFGGRDGDESVTLWLPSEVDDGILDVLDNLDWDSLLLDAENLKGRGEGLLGLRVTVDLDTQIGSLGLPVHAGISDREEVKSSNDFLRWDGHESDLGWVRADFWSPVAEELLVGLDTITLDSCWGPVEVDNTVNLDRGLLEKVHSWELVYRDGGSWGQSGDILVISGPLECWPLNLALHWSTILIDKVAWRLNVGERTEWLSGLNIPDNVVLSVVIDRQSWVSLLANDDWLVGPGGQVLLAWREIDQVDEWMWETLLASPGWSTPELNTLHVHGSEVCAEWGPGDEGLGPVGAVDNVLWRISLVVPENANLVVSEHNELVASASSWVGQPGAEMLLLGEWLDSWWGELLWDSSLAAVTLNIGELVNAHGVLLIDSSAVEDLDGLGSLSWSSILDESESVLS